MHKSETFDWKIGGANRAETDMSDLENFSTLFLFLISFI